MRGGALFKGKEGRGDFRKILRSIRRFESFNQHSALTRRSLAINSNSRYAVFSVELGNSISMTDIDSIDDALSVFTKFFQAPIEPFDTRFLIQQHIHFLVLVVTICPSLLQGVDEPLRHTI